MKHISVAFIIIFSIIFIFYGCKEGIYENIIQGRVIDKESNPLEGVNIIISKGDTVTGETGKEGIFILTELKSGEYTLIFHKKGYCDEKTKVNLQEGKPVELSIKLYEKKELLFLATPGSLSDENDSKEEKGIRVMDFSGKNIDFIKEENHPLWLKTTGTNKLFVIDSENVISILDINNNYNLLTKIVLPEGTVLDTEFDSEENHLYITGVFQGETGICIIDANEFTIEKIIKLPIKGPSDLPYGLAIDDEQEKAYVATGNSEGGKIVEVKLKDEIIKILTEEIKFPYDLVLNSDKSMLYISGFESNTVSAFDIVSEKTMSTINVENNPSKIILLPGEDKYYVLNSGTDTISILKDDEIIKTIKTGKKPVDIEFTQEGNKAFVSNNGSENITIIDTKEDTVIGETEELHGANPFGIGVTK